MSIRCEDIVDDHHHSLLEQASFNLARQHAHSFEQVIVEGVRRVLGRSDFKLEDLKGRVRRFIFPDNRQEFHLDGKPFVEFFPLRIARDPGEHPGAIKYIARQNYRYMGSATDSMACARIGG